MLIVKRWHPAMKAGVQAARQFWQCLMNVTDYSTCKVCFSYNYATCGLSTMEGNEHI